MGRDGIASGVQKCKPSYGLCKGAKVGRQRLNRLQKVGPVSLELTIADTLFSRDFMNYTSFVAGVSTFLFAVFIVGCGDSGRMSKENITAFNDAHDMASLFESPKSQFNLGLFYENGLGVEKNQKSAASWYLLAAKQGLPEAQHNLACFFDRGDGVLTDQVEAFAYFNLAGIHLEASRKQRDRLEDAMTPDAVLLGQQRARELKKDIDARLAQEEEENKYFEYLSQAEKGDAEAQLKVGSCYYNGRGVDKDEEKSYSWIRKSADQGNISAQNALGVLYYRGVGVVKDFEQAFTWFRKAAENGDDDAQFNLGRCFAMGQGVAQNYELAVFWYRKAADQRNHRAENSLGICHSRGHGVQQDYARAVAWYRKAAGEGHEEAQTRLGEIYAKGEGVPQDHSLAVFWYRKAAEKGHAEAQINLGINYENGVGVAKDEIEAYAFLNLAGMTDEAARKRLSVLEKKISQDARLLGQKRTKELQKEIEARQTGK